MSNGTTAPTFAPFSAVLVKPRINARKKALLEAALAQPAVILTSEQLESRRAARETLVGTKKWLRFGGRTDATGAVTGDTGKPVFTFVGAKHEAVSLGRLTEDLESSGYVLAHANVKQKQGDRMGFLELVYKPNGNCETPLVLSEDAQRLINEELSRSYGHLHVWDNRGTYGTATVNPAHAVSPDDLAQITDARTLRFRLDDTGAPHWNNVQAPASPKAADQAA